jgi:hypothetical protein
VLELPSHLLPTNVPAAWGDAVGKDALTQSVEGRREDAAFVDRGDLVDLNRASLLQLMRSIGNCVRLNEIRLIEQEDNCVKDIPLQNTPRLINQHILSAKRSATEVQIQADN